MFLSVTVHTIRTNKEKGWLDRDWFQSVYLLSLINLSEEQEGQGMVGMELIKVVHLRKLGWSSKAIWIQLQAHS